MVGPNSAVLIQIENSKEVIYLINDQDIYPLKENEINIDNALYKKIQGKKVNDEFIWEESLLGAKKAIIKTIRTKWQYAFNDTTALLETRYVEHKPFQSPHRCRNGRSSHRE